MKIAIITILIYSLINTTFLILHDCTDIDISEERLIVIMTGVVGWLLIIISKIIKNLKREIM
jgi:hypothetical protein